MLIDLHCHSTASDGTLTPEEMASAGKNLAVMALTDHDNFDGVERFLSSPQGAIKRLSGMELSINPGEINGEFHLLAFGFNPKASVWDEFLGKIRNGREERNQRVLERLAELGMPVTEAELAHYAKGEIVARPHIARVMMDHGWATSVLDAFQRYLGKGKSAYVARYRPDLATAIEVIHSAGGIAVMAHPLSLTTDTKLLYSQFQIYKSLNLDGIEAVYQAYTMGDTVNLLQCAKKLNFVVTAGSDYHGANKPTLHLGMEVSDDFLKPFLEKLS